MATAAAITAAVAAVGSGVAQMQATSEQNKAQKKAARMEQRRASLDAQRQARRAIAQSRLINAEMTQATETMGARTSSSLAGAVGGTNTQTAANIGHMNTQLAAELGINKILTRGASRAAKWNTIAGGFDAIGSISMAGASYYGNAQALQQQQDAMAQMQGEMARFQTGSAVPFLPFGSKQ
jgi:hypothetical protein